MMKSKYENLKIIYNRSKLGWYWAPLFALCWFVLFYLVVLKCYHYYPDILTTEDEATHPGSFIGERAEHMLLKLLKIGPRVVGSPANEQAALHILVSEISVIKRDARLDLYNFEYDVQVASGNFLLKKKINSYQTIQNVIVKITPKNSESKVSLLLNSHFDTAPGSPGAGDDGLMVAVMLETLRVITKYDTPIKHSIIFLFNGAEETPQQGSHAFVTQHKWAKNISAFINLDSVGSGGHELLFRSGPRPWILKYYGDYAVHPFASVLAEELMLNGLVPSTTDYDIFEEFGNLTGLDLTSILNGYVYHTKNDRFSIIPRGSYQSTGENVLALTKALASAPEMDSPNDQPEGKLVYFDFLGLFFIGYTESTGLIINIVTSIVAILTILAYIWNMAHQTGMFRRRIFAKFGILLSIQVAAVVLAFAFTMFIAFFMELFNLSMSWYSQKWMIFGLYFCPMFFVLGILPAIYLGKVKEHGLPLGYAIQLIMHSHCLILVLLNIVLTPFGVRSTVFLTIAIAFYTFSVILNIATCFHSKTFLWLIPHFLCQVVPFLFFSYNCHIFFETVVPFAGRYNVEDNPEWNIALWTAFVSLLFIAFLIPIFLLFRKSKLILSCFAAICLIFIVLAATPVSFPFTKESAKRVEVQHTIRTFHNGDPQMSINSTDSGFYIIPSDHRQDALADFIKDENATVITATQFPVYPQTFFSSPGDYVFWVPGPSPQKDGWPTVRILSKQRTSMRNVMYTIEISGPNNMGIHIDPLPDAKLVDWNFGSTEVNPSHVSSYLVFFTYGLDSSPFRFNLEFEGPERTNTEGLRSAFARLRNRTGPSPPSSPVPPSSHNVTRTPTTAVVTINSTTSTTTAFTTTTASNSNDALQINDQNVPDSPIFSDNRKSPTIVSTPPTTPKSRKIGTGVSYNTTSHAMTVSLTKDGTTTLPTKPSSGSPSYISTRSAAMMALTLGQRFRSSSPCNSIDREDPASGSNSPLRRKSVISVGRKMSVDTSSTPVMEHRKSSISSARCSPPTRSSPPALAAKPMPSSAISHVNGILSGGSSSGSDNDGLSNSTSSSATALRRFYFKSGRSAKGKITGKATDIPMNVVSTASSVFHTSVIGLPSNPTGVPKVVVMGSSSASVTEANISTSTDSASTLITNVTHTDTSETCDSMDLGDNSGQSEPLFSSIEEPLLTAIQVDSEQEHVDTELELTSCPKYSSRPDMYLQDSVESQESCLSMPLGEVSTTTPLLASRTYGKTSRGQESERLPNTAPAPTKATKHFTFDTPRSPKSARTSEGNRSHFTFKDTLDESRQRQTVNVKRTNEPDIETGDAVRNKTPNNRNRCSPVGMNATNGNKTSPKRSIRRSPCPSSNSKVNSAPPTMKDGNFFGNTTGMVRPKQSSPSSRTHTTNSRKYSSSSSSGGSDRDRSTMFPFDREAVDYERIQRECFAVSENSSSNATSSDSEEGEACSVYERRLSSHHNSPKSSDIFQQYTLLTQQEQQRPPSRKNSKRIRPESGLHPTIQENQQYIPSSDAFYPQQKSSTSPGEHSQTSPKSHVELNKFDDIAMKFEQIPPKHGSTELLIGTASDSNKANNNSPTGTTRDIASPAMSNLGVGFFPEVHTKSAHKRKSLKSNKNTGGESSSSAALATHDNLEECQGNNMNTNTGPAEFINVTPNPMEAATSTIPRATIVVQQPSLSLDNTVETLLIKNEGDFISVDASKDQIGVALTRKRSQQHTGYHHHNSQYNNQQTHLNQNQSQQQQQNQQQQQQQQQQQKQQQQQNKRDENIRQLLDVTNTLTFEELRDFEMRYGSPHHNRSQSVKAPGSRASGRPNQLCLPQQRLRIASMPNTGTEEEYYRLRHFSITGKGIVNRGDSLKSRRSRSNNSVASSNSSTEHLTPAQIPAPNSARNSANCSLASSRESSTSNPGSGPFRVLMLGGPAVGKSSLVSQFMTSEYLHAYDTSIDDESGEKSVSVLLNQEESELIFIDHTYTEMNPDDCLSNYDNPHGYCVIYSSSDRSSFAVAEHILQVLWTNQNIAQKAVILVSNKSDLARSRIITPEEGKAMATAYDCKYIETSVSINHNVDELLVGLLSQIRLKLENPEKSRDLFRKRSIRKSKRRACSPLGSTCLTGGTNPNTPLGPANNVITANLNTPPGSAQSSPRKYRGSRTSTSLKVKGLLGRVWARDSKSKSCENLHVL